MEYRSLSTAEKQRYHLERMREPPVRCPRCETSMPPDDLLPHMRERCHGEREPHHLSEWVTWKDAIALGISDSTLRLLVRNGRVRSEGERWKRRFLKRDIVRYLAGRDARLATVASLARGA